jgi:hypothetical protein
MARLAIPPGEHLAEELKALDMSVTELARQLKVPTNRVTGILNGQRVIYWRYCPSPRPLFRHQPRVLAESTVPL